MCLERDEFSSYMEMHLFQTGEPTESAGVSKPGLEFPNITEKKNCFQFQKYKLNLKIDTI